MWQQYGDVWVSDSGDVSETDPTQGAPAEASAPSTGEPAPVPAPAPIANDPRSRVKTIESANGTQRLGPAITDPDSEHFGDQAAGDMQMMPKEIRRFVKSKHDLAEKYGPKIAGMTNAQLSQFFAGDAPESRSADDEISGKFWDQVVADNHGNDRDAAAEWQGGADGKEAWHRWLAAGKPTDISPKKLERMQKIDSYVNAYDKTGGQPAPAPGPAPESDLEQRMHAVPGAIPEQEGFITKKDIAGMGSLDPMLNDIAKSKAEANPPLHDAAGNIVPNELDQPVPASVGAAVSKPAEPNLKVTARSPFDPVPRAVAEEQYRKAGMAGLPGSGIPAGAVTPDKLVAPPPITAPAPANPPAAAENSLEKQYREILNELTAQRKSDATWSAKNETDLTAMRADALSGKIDPHRLFANKSSADRILAAVSLGIGTFGATLGHAPNAAQEILKAAIDSDVEAQKNDLDRKVTIYGHALQQYGNERQARQAATQILWDQARVLGQEMRFQNAGALASKKLEVKGMLEEAAQQKAFKVIENIEKSYDRNIGKSGVGSAVGARIPDNTFYEPQTKRYLDALSQNAEVFMTSMPGIRHTPENVARIKNLFPDPNLSEPRNRERLKTIREAVKTGAILSMLSDPEGTGPESTEGAAPAGP